MSNIAASTVKVTAIEPCGENKVCITVELVVDVHRLADVSSSMLSVAAKGIASKKEAVAGKPEYQMPARRRPDSKSIVASI